MDNDNLGCLGAMALAIVLFIAGFSFQKCQDDNADYQTNGGKGYNTEIIDSCEYLVRQDGYAGYMAHKGNCKFCEERRKNNK